MSCRHFSGLVVLPLLALLLGTDGCRDEDQERLQATIVDLQTTVGGPEWLVERHSAQLEALQKLKGKRLDIPRIVYAARLPNPNMPGVVMLVVDYVDTQPQAEFYRLYMNRDTVKDLVEPDGTRELNEAKSKNIVLYTAAWIFESPNESPFKPEDEVYIEVHNPDGVVSDRVLVPVIHRPPFSPQKGPTTRPSTLPANGSETRE
jgi:hypothetical protein